MNKILGKALAIMLAAILCVLALNCAAPPISQTSNISVQTKKRVVEVRRGTLSENVSVEGNLEMPRYRNLRFGLSDGEVKEVLVKEGDTVKAGQLLAKLDDAKQRLDIKVANNTVQRRLSDLYETVPRLPQFQTIYNSMGVKQWDRSGNPVYYAPEVLGTNPYINYPSYYANSTVINAYTWTREEVLSAYQLFLSENLTPASSELKLATGDIEAVAMILEDAINNPDSSLGNMAPHVPTDLSELVAFEVLCDQPPAVKLIIELRKAVETVRQIQEDITRLLALAKSGNKVEADPLFNTVIDKLEALSPVLYSNVNVIEKRMDDDVYGKDLGIRFYNVAEEKLNKAMTSEMGSQEMLGNLNIADHYLQLCNGILGTNDYVLKHGLSLQNEQNYKLALASALVGLESAKNNLLNTYLWAPIDGMIVAVNIYPKKVLSQEQAVDAIVLVDTSYIEFWGTVDEIDSAKIVPDQNALISVDAVPDRIFSGKVTFLSSLGASSTAGATSTTSASSSTGGVVKFNVTIELDPTDVDLKGKLTATADIPISVTENALLLPLSAVSTVDGKSYVDVELNKGGATEKRMVKTGSKNTQYIQIIEGLKEGDRVVMEDKTVNVTVMTRPQGPPGGGPPR